MEGVLRVYVREKLKLHQLKTTIPTAVRDFLKAYDTGLASTAVTDPWNCSAAEWSKCVNLPILNLLSRRPGHEETRQMVRNELEVRALRVATASSACESDWTKKCKMNSGSKAYKYRVPVPMGTITGAQSMDEEITLENWFWHRPRRLESGRRRMLTSVPISVQRVRMLARQGGLKVAEAVSNTTGVAIGKGRVNQHEEARLQRIAENQKELNRVLKEKAISQNSVKSFSLRTRLSSSERGVQIRPRMRNGRPRELPEFVPSVKKSITNAPELQQWRLKAASVRIRESRAERRQKKQAERARNIALQRERSRIQQMIIADRQACAKVEAEREKCAKKLAAAEEVQRQLAQVSVAFEAGPNHRESNPCKDTKAAQKARSSVLSSHNAGN